MGNGISRFHLWVVLFCNLGFHLIFWGRGCAAKIELLKEIPTTGSTNKVKLYAHFFFCIIFVYTLRVFKGSKFFIIFIEK